MNGLLVRDACELIVCYLGATGDAMRLGLTCREWHDHVRHSRVWRQRLERRAPHSTAVLDADEADRRGRDDYAYGVAWQAHLALSRRHAFSRSTNFAPLDTNTAPGFMARVGGWIKRQYNPHHDEIRVMMVGLSGSGKSALIDQMRDASLPTIPFAPEVVVYQRFRMIVCCTSVVRSKKTRSLWRQFEGTRCVMLVVDATDREAMPECVDLVSYVLGDPDLAAAALCVIANKQDQPDAMPPDEVAHQLGLPTLSSSAGSSRRWCVQGCCATSGEGLQLALDWIEAATNIPASAAA